MNNKMREFFMDAYKVLLGEILIQRKKITREQLEAALQTQKKRVVLSVRSLSILGFLMNGTLWWPWSSSAACRISPSINIPLIRRSCNLIPKEVAQKEKVIALDRIGEILSVVMINPLTMKRKLFRSVDQMPYRYFYFDQSRN
jgi:hypothetical protein